MSRDWSPKELYEVDKARNKDLRHSVITWSVNGENVRIDNYLAKDRYPELSFLLDKFDRVYQQAQASEEALHFLDKVENALVQCEQGQHIEPAFDVVSKWFNGEFAFGRSDLNNEPMIGWMNDTVAHYKADWYPSPQYIDTIQIGENEPAMMFRVASIDGDTLIAAVMCTETAEGPRFTIPDKVFGARNESVVPSDVSEQLYNAAETQYQMDGRMDELDIDSDDIR